MGDPLPRRRRARRPDRGNGQGTPYTRLLLDGFIEAITSDPAWDGGWYKEPQDVHRGLRRHARLFALTGHTPAFFTKGIWKTIGYSSVDDFIAGYAESHFVPQDPNNLLLLLSK